MPAPILAFAFSYPCRAAFAHLARCGRAFVRTLSAPGPASTAGRLRTPVGLVPVAAVVRRSFR